jgi:PRTRC genetic system ThiF family protein
MQALTIDPILPFLVPELDKVCIALIGCGGTGSHIAQSLARLAVHCRESGGPEIMLVFVDGDRVEAKNVGRQLFSEADIGKNKAQALAGRFSAVFGLKITGVPRMLTQQFYASGDWSRPKYNIIVGAVDGATGRQAISATAHQFQLWIDCGNHESSGQVVAGNTLDQKRLKGTLALGICSALPSAPLIYPELLKDAPEQPQLDCAAAMQDNAQSLCVNQAMAAVASQYLYQVVVQRKLMTFRTVIDLSSLTMRSDMITARALATATGLTVKELTKKKAKRAA